MPGCAECFGDRGLRKSLIPARSAGIGNCSYCGGVDAQVVDPTALAEYFELVIGAYVPAAGGKTLVQLLWKDWGLFEKAGMDDARATTLLHDVLEEPDRLHQTFSPVSVTVDRLSDWEKLRDELMYKNRFFPDANMDLYRLGNLLDALKIEPDEAPSIWYRARIQTEDMPFPIAKMGAPPSRTATHGRANPAGIPYLYLGSQPDTAIAETRPHTGELVCVADFATPPDLRLVYPLVDGDAATRTAPALFFRRHRLAQDGVARHDRKADGAEMDKRRSPAEQAAALSAAKVSLG